MKSECPSRGNRFAALLALGGLLAVWQAQAQPTLVSSVPANGATGVSPTTTVVFTFSEAMDADTVTVSFFSTLLQPPFYTNYNTIQSWNTGTNILTCTPSPAFLSGTSVYWSVDGADLATGTYMDLTNGYFTAGSGGGGGSGTNAITTFSVGKVHHYNQTSSGSPTLDPITPYGFSGVTSLSSNRTATSVTLTLPTGSVSNLTQLPPPQAEIYILYGVNTSLSAYDATFPAGNYSFLVQAVASNQTVVVNLPTTNTMAQPGAPHLTNYPAAQAVNPGQTFVLGWDAFPGGTAADYIFVQIGTNYSSPNPGLPGALTGTARTFTIPAGTLQPLSTYDSTIGFYRHVGATNASFATDAYRATFTDFSLITTSSGPEMRLINPVKAAGGSFLSTMRTLIGTNYTFERATNLPTFFPLYSTNATVTNTLFQDASPAVNRAFYRVRKN